ncbi:hypothetical protein Vretifemale_5945 [Volvox reticuliferus]|uniref:Phospholipid/glycerol acyltransferase domain-containing protein n=1 Tax=Volvox reticuliferus TaxID=1737510 RepID=A0A8J4FID5_9CHLO|nr:hypothetical protein Vretifemale_5945 [Volvox reticuliferus]
MPVLTCSLVVHLYFSGWSRAPSFPSCLEVYERPCKSGYTYYCSLTLLTVRAVCGSRFPIGCMQLVRDRMLRKYDEQSAELPMLLFPEGTTTNNRYIMPFKRGAFVAGVPVQPLVLKYDTSGRFSPTWDSMPGHLHIFLAMTEFSFRVTCYMLPLYKPSEAEKADPALYAENVRQMMVKYSGIPACDDTYADKLAFFKYIKEQMAQQDNQGHRGPLVDGRTTAETKAPSKVEVEARAAVYGLRHRKEPAARVTTKVR